ncbi:hypothetical protein [Azospirillum canadense]|uniref:hypothetical protein n=1 Tax=Azospirillum canadense TaxID=403962 RepID=UPI0022261A63|nr:hypothetical protein [Azospirillum canadense]MCW2240371.1 hypothetical protein [Azospirillum canadense]
MSGRRGAGVMGGGLRRMVGATVARLLAAVLVIAVASVGAVVPRAVLAGGIGDLYAPPAVTGIGGGLWQGGATVPGAPAAQAGCAPTVQQAHGAAYAAGMRNALTISRSERQPPGKIMSACISTLISMLSGLDIFSNAGPWALQTIVNGILNFAEGLICQFISDQFNRVVAVAFNSIAFLNDVVPCGVGISLPGMNGGAGGADFCASLGGPLVNIGTPGGTVYTSPSASVIPPIISKNTGMGGSNVLTTILGR